MMDALTVTGRTDRHVIPLEPGHRLQPEAAAAFGQLQPAAAQAGFPLRPASSFRDFDRQMGIWNGKFHGQRCLAPAATIGVPIWISLIPICCLPAHSCS